MERKGRKLLVAAIGVATLNYAACDYRGVDSGNLVPPEEIDTGIADDTGAPDADAGSDTRSADTLSEDASDGD